jgi:hypothetical protein
MRIALLLALTACLTYWVRYQRGARHSTQRLNSVSNLKQIGLSFRSGHNDLARFTASEMTSAQSATGQR